MPIARYRMHPIFFVGPDDCSFEFERRFPCHWYNIAGYILTWIKNNGSTPSYNTGPTGDATVGFGGSKSINDHSSNYCLYSRKGV